MKNYSFALAIALSLQASCTLTMLNDELFDRQIYENIEMYEQAEKDKVKKLNGIREKIESRKAQNKAASKIQHAWRNYKNKKLIKTLQKELKTKASKLNTLSKQLQALNASIEFGNLDEFDQKHYSLAADCFACKGANEQSQAELLLDYPMLLTYYPYLEKYKK